MVTIRISNAFRAARTAAPTTSAAVRSIVYRRSIATTSRVMAQGYGDDSKDPQGQPGATKAQESSEHPGPSPPDVGKGTGGGPTKANSSSQKDPADASAASGGSRSKEAKETGSSPTGGSVGGGDGQTATKKGGEALKGPQGDGAPQPKIMNQSIPGAKPGLSEEQKQEVERHNADFEQRHDRAASAADDKVDKKFWNS
ncbi:hypothetical protein PG994_014314 [Apiospora phragmitis]|uniref:Uncharacterized protein n=1 Tax=Apiospora phragmitis TaxID=2905665 RepID=A0ABR1T408_9PEZI